MSCYCSVNKRKEKKALEFSEAHKGQLYFKHYFLLLVVEMCFSEPCITGELYSLNVGSLCYILTVTVLIHVVPWILWI